MYIIIVRARDCAHYAVRYFRGLAIELQQGLGQESLFRVFHLLQGYLAVSSNVILSLPTNNTIITPSDEYRYYYFWTPLRYSEARLLRFSIGCRALQKSRVSLNLFRVFRMPSF